jgi:ATP-binding cassette, subfamily B, bacterial AbcA/BmrA
MDTDRGNGGAPRIAGGPSAAEEGARHPSVPLSAFIKLVAGTRPSAPALALALTLGAASTIAGLFVPMLTKGIVDGFSVSSLGAGQIAMIAAAFLAQAAAGSLSGYLLARIGQGAVASLRERLWRKELSLTVRGCDREGSGPLVSRMVNDTSAVRGFITDNLPGLVNGAISIVGAVAFLLYLNWKLALIALAALPVAVLVLLPLGKLISSVARKTMDENASFTSTLSRVLSEARLVKASGAEEREFTAGRGAVERLRALGVREGAIMALVGPVMSLVMMSLLVVVIGYGGSQVASGALSAGDLVAFILYLFQVIMPAAMISQALTQLQKARGATESIQKLLRAEEESTGAGERLDGIREPIRFDSVGFSYEPGKSVLRGLSFELAPGSVTAIVGPSGSGKTTVFSLLERFYEPDEGLVSLGGKPVGGYSLSSWRRAIGYVPQDSPMMSGTIRENLTYGADPAAAADERRIREAARAAFADDFIEALPRGYDTEVGERGVKLSGGQRQRIAIARALLRDPSLLMLDEATSSLDSGSEELVQRALDNLMRGRTTLVIAHRLSTVIDADRILFLEGGEITGAGTHGELLATHELYRTFAERQLRMPAAAAVA